MRILVTGAGGIVGTEVLGRLAAHPEARITRVTRGPVQPGDIGWHLGEQEPPAAVRQRWDTVVHLAASTRWTMSRTEAERANIASTASLLDVLDPDTHLVHVSTAYVSGERDGGADGDFDGYRNGYEWSKAACERLVTERHRGPLTIVRPPLILGRRADGGISRFTGPYTLLQCLVSGLAAVVVGDPEGYAEIAPVDEVADAVTEAVLGPAPTRPVVETLAAGAGCLRLRDLVDGVCGHVNAWREARGLAPIATPPLVSADSWHRFFLPLAEQHLSPIQHEAVRLLGMFERYTSMAKPFVPTRQVDDPATVLARSVLAWAEARPRLAARTPTPWTLIGAGT